MWKLQRIWDYFLIVSTLICHHLLLQYGWKAIFKVALILLGENEEKLLDMPFEMILGQISQIPIRFVLEESQNIEESIKKFDK